ncbi:MAG TPA: recombinase family protein [Roseiflexaceae bacterium]
MVQGFIGGSARAAIYVRVSTIAQEENYSLPMQLEKCRAYAAEHGMTIVIELQDVESGATKDRPGLLRLRELIRAGALDTVIVYALDRLTRNLAHMLLLRDELKKHHVELHYCTRGQAATTPIGELFENIEASFGEFERLRIAERLQDGKHKKISGSDQTPGRALCAYGAAPFGYRFEGTKRARRLVVVPEEAAIVAQLFHWLVVDGLSTGACTDRLTALGIATPRDRGRPIVVTPKKNDAKRRRQRRPGEWNNSSVVKILRNRIYVGLVDHYKVRRAGKSTIATPRAQEDWVTVQAPELAIVDRALWDRAQARLDAGQLTSIRNAKHFYLLGQHVTCTCGYSCYGKCRGQGLARYYQCGGRQKKAAVRCDRPSVRADALEIAVWDWLYAELTPEKIQQGLETQRASDQDRRSAIAGEIATLETQRAESEQRRVRAIMAFEAGALTIDELRERKAIHDAALRSIDAELARLDAQLHEAAAAHDQAAGLLAYATVLHDELPHLTDDRKRQLLYDVQLTVMLETDDDGGRWASVTCLIASDRIPITNTANTSYSAHARPG